MMGTLVVDEVIYPIARITLTNGAFLVAVGPIDGPVGLPAVSEVRLHDPDGGLVVVAPWRIDERTRAEVAALRPGDTATILLPIQITEVDGWPAPTAGGLLP